MPSGLSTLNTCRANPVLETRRGCLLCQHCKGSSPGHRQNFFNHIEIIHVFSSAIFLKRSPSWIPFLWQLLAYLGHQATEKEAASCGQHPVLWSQTHVDDIPGSRLTTQNQSKRLRQTSNHVLCFPNGESRSVWHSDVCVHTSLNTRLAQSKFRARLKSYYFVNLQLADGM